MRPTVFSIELFRPVGSNVPKLLNNLAEILSILSVSNRGVVRPVRRLTRLVVGAVVDPDESRGRVTTSLPPPQA